MTFDALTSFASTRRSVWDRLDRSTLRSVGANRAAMRWSSESSEDRDGCADWDGCEVTGTGASGARQAAEARAIATTPTATALVPI